MENYPDNKHVFDEGIVPQDDYEIPDDDPFFLTHNMLENQSHGDRELYRLVTERFYTTVDVTIGKMDAQVYKRIIDELDEDIKQFRPNYKASEK